MSSELTLSNADEIQKFEPIKEIIAQIIFDCKNIVINSPESHDIAKDKAKIAKKTLERINDMRKQLVQPYNDKVKDVNGYAKDLTSSLNAEYSLLRNKILGYEKELNRLAEIEATRIAEEKRKIMQVMQEKEADGEQLSGEDVAKLIKIQEDELKVPAPLHKSTRVEWTFDVIDKTKVPLLYLTVDEKKVKDDIKRGIANIPGLHIYQKETLVLK